MRKLCCLAAVALLGCSDGDGDEGRGDPLLDTLVPKTLIRGPLPTYHLPLLTYRLPVPTYKVYAITDEQPIFQQIYDHRRILAQNDEFRQELVGGYVPVMLGGVQQRVRFTEAMTDFLWMLDANAVQMRALFVYGSDRATVDTPHVRSGLWADPPDPTTYLNHALDITSFGGIDVSAFDADHTLSAVVGMIDALPSGVYELGIPREAYPTGASDRRGSSASDVKRYFKPDAGGIGRTYLTYEVDLDAWQIDETRYGALRRFMPWYTNEFLDAGRAELQADINGMPTADAAALRKALATSDSPNIARFIMRDRGTGIAIADAMQRAIARGVHFKGIYGDALDHFHITVREVDTF